jgi:hypothetical protein
LAGHSGVSSVIADTDTSGIRGTAEQIDDRLEGMIAVGVANPISRHAEQLESLVEIDGLG